MKDHKRHTRYLPNPDGMTVDAYIEQLRKLSADLVNPSILVEGGYDYDPDEYMVVGYQPMTPEEIEKARKAEEKRKATLRRKKELQAQKKALSEAKQRERELKLLAELKAKYENTSWS